MLIVKSTVEKTLDISFFKKHSSKFSFKNIWNMILHLTFNSLALIKENYFTMNFIQNMLFIDLFRLNENIRKYNEQMMFNELSLEDDIDFYFKIFQKFEFIVIVYLKKKNMNNNDDSLNSVESITFMKKENNTFFFNRLRIVKNAINQIRVARIWNVRVDLCNLFSRNLNETIIVVFLQNAHWIALKKIIFCLCLNLLSLKNALSKLSMLFYL